MAGAPLELFQVCGTSTRPQPHAQQLSYLGSSAKRKLERGLLGAFQPFIAPNLKVAFGSRAVYRRAQNDRLKRAVS